MKKLLFMLLFAGNLFAQKQVFNVQGYCIDEKPFKTGTCDIAGNEYSFVFLDREKKEVVFFLTSMKMKFTIVSEMTSEVNPDQTVFTIENENGRSEMRLNRAGTKIEFSFPDQKIYLTVGKSTKSVE